MARLPEGNDCPGQPTVRAFLSIRGFFTVELLHTFQPGEAMVDPDGCNDLKPTPAAVAEYCEEIKDVLVSLGYCVDSVTANGFVTSGIAQEDDILPP